MFWHVQVGRDEPTLIRPKKLVASWQAGWKFFVLGVMQLQDGRVNITKESWNGFPITSKRPLQLHHIALAIGRPKNSHANYAVCAYTQATAGSLGRH